MKTFLTLCIISVSSIFYGQEKSSLNLEFQKTDKPIKIDGLQDSAWSSFQLIDGFQKSSPIDSGFATSKTEVRICYDEKYFYLFATCFETKKGKYIVQSLKRDFSFPRTDAFVVFIDPFNDGTNGFSFACNPYGAQREGVLELGGQYGVTTSWDNKWYSATQITDSSYTVEMAIPFNSIRFNENNRTWKINFARNDQKINETSTWAHVPRNFNVANLAFTADLNWQENPPVSGKNVSLIPYAIAGANDSKAFADLGMDAKIGISTGLNLDLTLNPDFSNVDVDQQVTNLDRFEIFFPERRQFFIENSDLFGSLGSSNARPFFSRRIGIGTDSAGNRVENPILGGARVTGKINDSWRVGAMSVQTSNGPGNDLSPENFSIASVQRKVFKRSNIGAFALNKEVFSSQGEHLSKNYVRVAGAEFNVNSWNSKWQGKSYIHTSLDSAQNYGINQGFNLMYSTKFFSVTLNQELVTNDFNSEVGFVRRKDYLYLKPSVEYLIYPKNTRFIYHDFGGGIQSYTNLNGEMMDLSNYVFYKSQLKSTSLMQFTVYDNFLVLQRDFDPSNSKGKKLKEGSSYRWNALSYQFISNERKPFFIDAKLSLGQYFNGERYSITGSARFRVVPKFVLSMNYSFDKIVLPSPYNSVNWTLFGPQVEYLFTTKLFWTTYIQYNQQLNNININSRLQWRFKPASDLFIVYTDNYLPETFGNKSRGVVVKFTYWFNI